jgi:excisionase family DNA binding protein|tara:strand:- start:268 stop:486 length:219 start_codon:yes stop_codon:yes gene_type:complete
MDIRVLEILNEIKDVVQDKMSNRWMDIREAVKYTSVSESTIRRAIKRGELKPSRSLGKLLFRVSEIERWLSG